jgi:hypothetical protein
MMSGLKRLSSCEDEHGSWCERGYSFGYGKGFAGRGGVNARELSRVKVAVAAGEVALVG